MSPVLGSATQFPRRRPVDLKRLVTLAFDKNVGNRDRILRALSGCGLKRCRVVRRATAVGIDRISVRSHADGNRRALAMQHLLRARLLNVSVSGDAEPTSETVKNTPPSCGLFGELLPVVDLPAFGEVLRHVLGEAVVIEHELRALAVGV
jgi:hypothetical protein